MEERVLDDLVKEKNTALSSSKKVFRVIEGILRLLFFSLITFFVIVNALEMVDWMEFEGLFKIGIIVIMLIFELFYINHLIQGVRCILIKEYKTYLFFPITSLIGLFLFLLVVIIAFFDSAMPNPEFIQVIIWAMFTSLIIFLIIKEFTLMKKRVR